MRLDKYLCESSDLTRSQARSVLLDGDVTVNGEVIKRGTHEVQEGDEVQWEGETLSQHPPVIDLLDVDKRDRLQTVGRLDVDTTGLILVTDDGKWMHRIISPRNRCDKVYLVTLAEPLPDNVENLFKQGIELEGEAQRGLSASLVRIDERSIRLTIQDGKDFHIKRMFESLGYPVLALHCERIGPVVLDADLQPGESRYLTATEVAGLAHSSDEAGTGD
jgi:16S rRNA pseudouridine516 synthase